VAALGFVVMSVLSAAMAGQVLAVPERDAASWRQGLVEAGLSADCASALEVFLRTDGGSTSAGATLERNQGSDGGLLARLARTGGIPFYGAKDWAVRAAARFDTQAGTWVPKRESNAGVNRGYALWSPAPGRDLLVIDHMRSPVSAATTIWEDTAKGPVLRAEFPAEIMKLEERDTEIVVHSTDTFNAVSLAWDKGSGAFVGRCLIRVDALASDVGTLPAEVVAVKPTRGVVIKSTRLELYTAVDFAGSNLTLDKLRSRERVFVLRNRPDGSAFVLAPWRDKSSATRLFRVSPDRLWQVGWVAPGTLKSE
jgi:hypothetical protein